MKFRYLSIVLCMGVLVAAVWIGKHNAEDRKPEGAWTQVASGVYRSPGSPAGYALVAGGRQVFVVRGASGETADGSDTFLAVDVQPR